MKGSPTHELSATFVDIPDDPMLLVAQFLKPPQVYNLCLTNHDRFFRQAGNSASLNDGMTGGASAASHQARGGNAPGALFSTNLLRHSLLSSLRRVLRKSSAGLSLDQVSFSGTPRGSVVLTGSSMVQCCLGETYKLCDLDVFCTTGAAPAVRSWLIKEGGMLFQGFCDTYVGVEDLTHPIDSKIHHVEYYSLLPEDGEEQYYSDPFDYKKACDFGKHVNENYAMGKWEYTLGMAGVVDATNPKYRIKPLPGDPFPFNYEFGHGAIDLVVATDQCSSASELLEDFDLNICKAFWDGEVFSIPGPHYTFAHRSKMEPMRKAFVQSYMRHYSPAIEHFSSDSAKEKVGRIRSAMRGVAAELGDSYFCRGIYFRQQEKELCLQFHNFVYKLVKRLEKYQKRGIIVQDAPDTSNFPIRSISAMDAFDVDDMFG